MRAIVAVVVVVLVGCGRQVAEKPVVVTPEPAQQQSLQGLLGVTVVPGTHERWWLKDGVGVVDSTGKTVAALGSGWDDMVALDSSRVALIRQNDGYVYEVGTLRLLNRFCYLPDSSPPDTWQRSYVVGWDVAEQRLYVQPQTFNQAGRVGEAQVGVFRADLATPLEWQTVGEPEMQAGGIAVESRSRIWLGWQSTLYLYDANARAVVKTFPLDVSSIDALALDGDQLLVLDGKAAKLSSIPLATLN